MVDWGVYEVYVQASDRRVPYGELTRGEARANFDALMASKDERIEQLRRLVATDGVDLDGWPEGVQRLNDWYVANVQPHPTEVERLEHLWYSVATDIAVLLGESLVRRSGGRLRWELYVWGKRNVSYHRPVVMGFDAPNPRYNADYIGVVTQEGTAVAWGERARRTLFVDATDLADMAREGSISWYDGEEGGPGAVKPHV